jgi:hypothetical protein
MCMLPARYLGCATGVVPWPWLMSFYGPISSLGWDSHMQWENSDWPRVNPVSTVREFRFPIPQRRTLLKTVTFRFRLFELSTVAPIIILFHSTNSSSSLLGFPFQ